MLTPASTPGTSIPQASIDELKSKLKQGPVRFAFRKKDGSLRLAYGTLDLDKIPASNRLEKYSHRTIGFRVRTNFLKIKNPDFGLDFFVGWTRTLNRNRFTIRIVGAPQLRVNRVSADETFS